MKLIQLPQILVVGLLTCSAAATAQTAATGKPLDLNLSPADVAPAAAVSSGSGSGVLAAADRRFALPPLSDPGEPSPVPVRGAAAVAHAAQVASSASTGSPTPPPAGDRPGVYYGDHSVDLGDNDMRRQRVVACDDSTYNQPHVHGSITTGIASGSHVGTGSYTGGVVNISKAFGSCEDPGGGISISVGSTTSSGFGHRWHH